MLHQPLHRYQQRNDTGYSPYSSPHRDPNASYEIHLIKSDDPNHIPADLEVWPLYHNAVLMAVRRFPEAFQAACAAVAKVHQQIKGLKNRHDPPEPDSPAPGARKL